MEFELSSENIQVGVFHSEMLFNNIEFTPPRLVRQYEIELYIEDGGSAIIGSTEYPIKKGMLLCAKPGQMRNSRLQFKCRYIHFATDNPIITERLHTASDIIESGEYNTYVQLFDDIQKTLDAPFEGQQFYLQSKFMELLYYITVDSLRQSRQKILNLSVSRDLIYRAIDFIQGNYQISITLKSIAGSVNLSPIYFHKVFSAYMGKTPNQYLLEFRINEAKKLLLKSDLSMGHIAAKCGFSSQSYFNYQFKKLTNKTPRQYRNHELLYLEKFYRLHDHL